MNDSSISIVVLVVLLLLHAGLEFSYAVLTNYRHTVLAERSEGGDRRARRTLKLSNDRTRLYIATQLLLTGVRFAIVAVAVLLVEATMAFAPEGSLLIQQPALAFALVLVPLALLTYVLGDLIPSAYGAAYADQAVGAVTSVMRPLVVILNPIVAIFVRISKVVARMSGTEDLAKSVTEEEIIALVDVGQESGSIESEEKEMIYSVLQFGETLAREVMIPRPDIEAIEINSQLRDALKEFIDSGHSRLPVYEDDVDDIKGLLYAKDLLMVWHKGTAEQTTIRSLMRPGYFVPETKRADMLFKEMQERKIHIAIIVDEYGGTAGLVTIEDLIEEIVGDIKDEYDFNEEAEYVKLSDNEYVVDGSMNVGDLNALLQTNLPTDENDSIGGFVYSQLDRVPEVGEMVDVPEQRLQLRIEAVEDRRIRKIRILRLPEPIPEPEPEEAPRRRSILRRTSTDEVEVVEEALAAEAPMQTAAGETATVSVSTVNAPSLTEGMANTNGASVSNGTAKVENRAS